MDSAKKHHVYYSKYFSQQGAIHRRGITIKYERILLLTKRILVMRIRIYKYDVFWLGVFGVL